MFIKKIFIGLLTSIVVKTARHTKYVSLSNQKRFNLILLSYILMNILKDYITINLLSIQVNVLEVVILLMTCLINCIPNKTEDLNLSVFNMITGKINRKH